MLFVVFALDRPDAQALRLANRQAHLDYLKSFEKQLVFAGPLQTDDGEGMVGSLLVMDFPDHAAARAFSEGDPYRKAGLFRSVEIRRWKKVLPNS
ncbi:MAG: YciI family protein [Magnetospirillum sp. WYHS-4]